MAENASPQRQQELPLLTLQAGGRIVRAVRSSPSPSNVRFAPTTL
jgi:hypothetical protein